MKNKHLGGDFDDFLREQDMLAGAEAVAAKCARLPARKGDEEKGIDQG